MTTATALGDRCASPKCERILSGGKSVIVARDGRRYCKRHGDHLPSYLRRPARAKSKAVARQR